MKQTQTNPWDQVANKYPPNTMIEGTVRNLTNYGAFIEIEEGIDGLLHISDMSWTRKIGHPNEVLEKGQKISCPGLERRPGTEADRARAQTDQGRPLGDRHPNRYGPGDVVTGKVTKLTNFGVFVELEPGLEGLLHISELADHKVDSPRGSGQRRRRYRGQDPPGRPRRAEDWPLAQESAVDQGRTARKARKGPKVRLRPMARPAKRPRRPQLLAPKPAASRAVWVAAAPSSAWAVPPPPSRKPRPKPRPPWKSQRQ